MSTDSTRAWAWGVAGAGAGAGAVAVLVLSACSAPALSPGRAPVEPRPALGTALGNRPDELAPGAGGADPAGLVAPGPVPAGRLHILEAAGGIELSGALSGTGSTPIGHTTIVLTDPEGRFYAIRASTDSGAVALVAPTTDASGTFVTVPVFPPGTAVFLTALLAGNRHLEGYTVAGAAATADITTGSTFAVEFLRDQARFHGSTPAAYLGRPGMSEALLAQGRRAGVLVQAGIVPEPSESEGDLVLGNGLQLASRYIASAFARDEQTRTAWNAVLPHRVRALTTLAGTFRLRYDDATPPAAATSLGMAGPLGVAQGAAGDDAIYLAEETAGYLKRVSGGVISLVAGRVDGDPSLEAAIVSADGTPAGPDLRLGDIRDIQIDRSGNMAMAFTGFSFLGFLCRDAGSHFGRPMASGSFYVLGRKDGQFGFRDGPLESALFLVPRGLTFDDAGNLFVCDRRSNLVRRIDGQTGDVSTIVGDGWPWIGPPEATGAPPFFATLPLASGSGTASVQIRDFGRLVDRPLEMGGGRRASLNRPEALAWRPAGDRQELYIYDSYNNAIRVAVTAYPGDFRSAPVEVRTVAGLLYRYDNPLGYSVTVGRRATAIADGPAPSVALALSDYDPAVTGAQPVSGGLAIDRERGLLFFKDTGNRAIRVLDLARDAVSTIAAHGTDTQEGDAMRVPLSPQLGALAVLRNHDLAIADEGNNVVRILHLADGL